MNAQDSVKDVRATSLRKGGWIFKTVEYLWKKSE